MEQGYTYCSLRKWWNTSRIASIVSATLCMTSNAELSRASFAGYLPMGYSNDQPVGYQWGAFHYTNVHTLMPIKDFGRYFQSGLFHTWYAPDVKGNREQIGYHKIEGGPGYKPYLRFLSKTTPQKFTMGGVAGGFGSFSNGPGQGSPPPHRGDWDENRGRYGAAQLSNSLLFPLDGINIENGTENEMLGYGYYALPLTEPKTITAGKNVPTGNHCWTLFLQSETFSGPVAFYTPYHWSKYTLDEKNAHMRGKTFDNNIMKKGRSLSMETQTTLGKRWIAPNGDKYFRVVPMTFPLDKDGLSRKGAMSMSFNSTKWDQMNAWFAGGKVAPTNFASNPNDLYTGTFKGEKRGPANSWKLITPDTDGDGPQKKEKIPIDSSSFMTRVTDSPNTTHAIKWSGDLITKLTNPNLIRLPEFYKLAKNNKRAIPIHRNKIPKESGLLDLNSKSQYKDFFKINDFNTGPISTPLHPDYTKSDKVIDAWTKPGPVAGPYTTKLGDGSTAVYYWYKFNEQPSILNSDMPEEERELIQKRVELIHQHWTEKGNYFPTPNLPIAALDPGLFVTPPKGLEIGYVPICVHQQLTKEELPKFKTINLTKR